MEWVVGEKGGWLELDQDRGGLLLTVLKINGSVNRAVSRVAQSV
jgi:hypothetical protein